MFVGGKHGKNDLFTERDLPSIFTDNHYGRAITKEEWNADEKWKNENSDIILQAQQKIAMNEGFKNLSVDEQVFYSAGILTAKLEETKGKTT